MTDVSLADRLFLAAESTSAPQHVAALGIFSPPDGAPDDFVAQLGDDFRAARTFAAPFNYRLRRPALKAIVPSWEELPDEEIDLNFHFRHNALPQPGGQRELGQLVSRLHSRPLDHTRPLWELHLIEGLDDGRFAMYLKVHHALMDGIGGVRRFTAMVSTDPEDRQVTPIWAVGPRRGSRSAAAKSSPLGRAAGVTRTMAGLGGEAARMVNGILRRGDAAQASPFAAPRTPINGRISSQRRVATQTYDFDRIRAVAEAAGVTVNDVFLAICGGGLRRYLLDLGELPDAGLTAGTPVSVRAGNDDTSTNAFTMTVMPLRTDIADARERLAAIHHASSLAKARLTRLSKPVAENQAALFMGPFVAQQLTPLAGHTPPPYNVSVSNIPGPLEPQYLAGARLESLHPLALVYHGVALFIAAFTISGRFGIGFAGDRDSLPHMQHLAVYTGDALEELEAVLAPTPTLPSSTAG